MKRIAIFALSVLPLVAWAGSSGVMPDGPNAWRVMHTGKTGFVSSGSLQRKAYEEANAFCANAKKPSIMETISMDSKRAEPFGGFPEATLRFRCVEQSSIAAGQSSPDKGVDLTDKYTKLEQLKRLLDSGALTQEEFNTEKAKILAQ